MNLKPDEVAHGAIGVNLRKSPGSKQPDFTGSIETEMGPLRISAWALTNPDGGKFISFSIFRPREPSAANKKDMPVASTEIAQWTSALFATKPTKAKVQK